MTSIHINSAAEMRRIAEYCAGSATAQARDSMACPKSTLKRIVNFFTFGAVRKERVKAYDEFAAAMTMALHQASSDAHACKIPDRLVVDFSGYTVTFTRPGEHHNADGPVTIEVSKSGKTETGQVDHDAFQRISTALLLRQMGRLPSTAVVLNDNNRMDLKCAVLHRVNLSGVNLSGADLREANLHEANLHEANLSGADLSGADLIWVNLSGADLSGVDLSGHDLYWVNLSGADLSGADLSDANLGDANLSDADLSGVNLSGADLSRADLSRADLSGADLSGVDLSWAKLSGARLSNTLQEGALLSLPDKWDPSMLDDYLNHINNPASGSLLTMMDSIDEQYADVKLRMARELMTSLQNTTTDTSSVALPLMDILSKPPYIGEAAIATWLGTVCERYLSQYNGQVLPEENAGVLNQSVDLFTRRPELMLSHNGAFIQIIAQGMAEQSTPGMKSKAAALYETYLQHEQVKPYCSLDEFGDGEGKPDWDDKHAVNIIILSAQPAMVSTMLLSQASLEGMLRPQVGTAWDNVYLYKDAVNLSPAESPALDELFARAFPVFSGPYQHTQNNAKLFLLLKALNLGCLETAFVSATGAKYSATKLVDDDAQIRLGEIFHPKLVSSPLQPRGSSLEEAHYGELIHAYNLTRASSADKAKTLLCLAALFTRYSSSAVFGTERESPQLLRQYAYALMAKAHALDANLLKANTLADWTNRLLGLEGAFTCSAVLSNLMVEHIRSRFPAVMSGIMPPAWG